MTAEQYYVGLAGFHILISFVTLTSVEHTTLLCQNIDDSIKVLL